MSPLVRGSSVTESDHAVSILLVALDGVSEAERTACARWLTPDERRRSERLLRPEARLQHIVGRALLRTTLSRYADVPPGDWRFRADAFGKPQIDQPALSRDLRFNLSHTDGLVTLAVTEGLEVGVDVENIGRNLDAIGLARTAFAPEEVATVERAPLHERQQRFFALWTLKEAYSKARGLGLSLPFDTFSFDLDDRTGTIRFTPPDGDDPERWSFQLISPTPHHTLALAARTERLNLSTSFVSLGSLMV